VVADLLRRLRRAPERALHALRRRRALAALRRRSPGSLLIVCHGNICRSPFAAALLAHALVRENVRVESGGFIGPNRPSPVEAVVAAARRGVDLSAHRGKPLTPDSVRGADVIVVMNPTQRRAICDRFGRARRDVLLLGDFDPQPIDTRAIRDPVDQPLEVFEETYARIERCVRELGRAIR
jgi:protein-tyrosine phosphatase